MGKRYLHFTDLEGAKAISESGVLWKSSFGPAGSVFAVVEGGAWVPGVQMTSMGRAKSRSAVVIFETDYLPDSAYPEEVIWHMSELPIRIIKLTVPSVAKKMLTDSIPQDSHFDMLQIPLHPSFGIFGDWTRMPEDFEPWVPGKDNEKYIAASQLWHEDQDIETMRDLWNDTPKKESKTASLVRFIVEQELEQYVKSKLPVEKGEEWDTSTNAPEALEVEEEVFDMIDASYKSIGGNPKIQTPSDVHGAYPHEVLADVDSDPEPDSVVMYSTGQGGNKYTVLASDGTSLGKMQALNTLRSRLNSGGWIEVSGPLAHVLINKMGMKPIEDEDQVRSLLGPSREIEWVGDDPTGRFSGTSGWYQRKIGPKLHYKIIVGNPR